MAKKASTYLSHLHHLGVTPTTLGSSLPCMRLPELLPVEVQERFGANSVDSLWEENVKRLEGLQDWTGLLFVTRYAMRFRTFSLFTDGSEEEELSLEPVELIRDDSTEDYSKEEDSPPKPDDLIRAALAICLQPDVQARREMAWEILPRAVPEWLQGHGWNSLMIHAINNQKGLDYFYEHESLSSRIEKSLFHLRVLLRPTFSLPEDAGIEAAKLPAALLQDLKNLTAFGGEGPLDPTEAGPLGELWPFGAPNWCAELERKWPLDLDLSRTDFRANVDIVGTEQDAISPQGGQGLGEFASAQPLGLEPETEGVSRGLAPEHHPARTIHQLREATSLIETHPSVASEVYPLVQKLSVAVSRAVQSSRLDSTNPEQQRIGPSFEQLIESFDRFARAQPERAAEAAERFRVMVEMATPLPSHAQPPASPVFTPGELSELRLPSPSIPPDDMSLRLSYAFREYAETCPDRVKALADELMRTAEELGGPRHERTLGLREAARRISEARGRKLHHNQLLRFHKEPTLRIGAPGPDGEPRFSEYECDHFIPPQRPMGRPKKNREGPP